MIFTVIAVGLTSVLNKESHTLSIPSGNLGRFS